MSSTNIAEPVDEAPLKVAGDEEGTPDLSALADDEVTVVEETDEGGAKKTDPKQPAKSKKPKKAVAAPQAEAAPAEPAVPRETWKEWFTRCRLESILAIEFLVLMVTFVLTASFAVDTGLWIFLGVTAAVLISTWPLKVPLQYTGWLTWTALMCVLAEKALGLKDPVLGWGFLAMLVLWIPITCTMDHDYSAYWANFKEGRKKSGVEKALKKKAAKDLKAKNEAEQGAKKQAAKDAKAKGGKTNAQAA